MWWGGLQFVSGVALVIAVHVRAFLRVASDDARVGPLDFLPLSPRIWRLTFQRLPDTSWLVVMAGWGVLLTVSAFFLGGIPFASKDNPDSLHNTVARTKPAEYQAIQQAAASDLENRPPPPENPPERQPRPEDRNKVQCTIIGYRTNSLGLPTEIIVARANGGNLRYAGVVRLGAGQALGLIDHLRSAERQEGPSGVGSSSTVWLKPGTHCEVRTSGNDPQAPLDNAHFGRLLTVEDN
jgi:hypothetical protein